MKPCFYTKLPILLFALCAPALCTPASCAPAKIVRADVASAKVSQRKQVLHYYIPVCLLTHRISYVQRTENNLLQHPSMWYNPKRPKDDVWSRKMRAQVLYVHQLRQEAKSLTVPAVCRPANQDLVACLSYLEVACSKLYQAQMVTDRTRGELLANEGEEASAKSKVFQAKFLDAIGTIQQRFHMPMSRYNVTDWPSASM